MSNRPLLTMCLIARDEEHNIVRCFNSWWEHVDEVVLLDTGSKDRTVQKAREYAAKRNEPDKLKVERFEWCDDFSAARNEADRHATGEWLTWCDLDDEVRGLERLRPMAADAAGEVVAFFCRYDYARDADGNCLSELWRERVVRNGAATWTGRLHEHKLFTQGAIVRVDPEIADWIHMRQHERGPNERNIRILERWDREDPGNPRVLSSLGLDYMGAERLEDAVDAFSRYLDCPGEPTDRRCQASRYLSAMLLQLGRVEESRAAAFRALAEEPLWADTHLSLAESAQTLGKPQEGYRHALTALEVGKPQTLLIVNPLQYTAHPRALMAICAAQAGDLERALKLSEEVLAIAPSYALITQSEPIWREHLKRQRTVQAFIACAGLLEEHGELRKARALIDCLPAYASEEPQVIERRAEIERHLQEALAKPPEPLREGAAGEFVLRQLEAAAA